MKTKNTDYWINRLENNNSDVEAKDENENSYKKIAEYMLQRERNNKNLAA